MKYFKIIFVVFIVINTLPVQANKDALAKAQYMLRQMNAELNQLKGANQKLLAEKSQLEKEKTSLQKKYDKLTNKSAKTKTAMKGEFSDLKKMYKDELVAHEETRKQLAIVSGEKKDITGIASQQSLKIEICAANNKKLFDINQQLLVSFEEKGVWDSLTQAEPFSQFTQVEIENLVDDAQYSMDTLRVKQEM